MADRAALDLFTADIQTIQNILTRGTKTSVELVTLYLDQVSRHDDHLHAMMIDLGAQSAIEFATELDQDVGEIRGPQHGIPFVVKDNIATHPDLGFRNTSGSLAFVGARPPRNAKVVEQLVKAGAIVIGKSNLSELSNFKGTYLTSGWSAVRGQTQSAYARGDVDPTEGKVGHNNPAGSSSGSAVAVSAGYAPFALGTETDGSLIVPAGRAALYTIKPTIGLLSQEGVCPISHNFDSAGPMAKSAFDIAVVLDALVDPNAESRGGKSYTESLEKSWLGISVGTLDPEVWKLPDDWVRPVKAATEQMILGAFATISRSGVKRFVENIDLIGPEAFDIDGRNSIGVVSLSDFEQDLKRYIDWLKYSPVKSLKELIQFNPDHSNEELPPDHNNQDTLLASRDLNLARTEYRKFMDYLRHTGRDQGIDRILDKYGLDVIIGPADSFLTSFATATGYPIAAMPLGALDINGRAFGMAALAGANEEALLIKVMSAWESTFGPRPVPVFPS